MASVSITRERGGREVSFFVSGTFDRASAWRLRGELEGVEGDLIVLDFTRAPDISDLGLAVLAHGLTRAHHRIVCRGLRQHHLRVFRYCGVDLEDEAEHESQGGLA